MDVLEEKPEYRNILVAVLGLTPQIITETLYGLIVERKIKIHQIVIITTGVGEKILNESFLKVDGALYQFFQEYEILPHEVSLKIVPIKNGQGEVLEDIRTRQDNEDMAKTIMQTVYQLTADNNTRLFASIAGGRKTMSAYMALALQLFGREQDRLMHVLIWPPALESDREFYFPPKSKKEVKTSRGDIIPVSDIRIDLAEIPFIRLRNTIQEELGNRIENYLDLIELSQFKINELKESISCEWHVREHQLIVKFGDRQYPPISISGKLGAIYHTIIQDQPLSLTDEIRDKMKENYKKYYRERDFNAKKYGKTWDDQQLQKDISTIREKIKTNLPSQLTKLVTITSERTYEKTTYYIPFPPRIIT